MKVTITTDRGTEEVEAFAVVGALAITQRRDDIGWTFTHIPTGRCLTPGLPPGLLSARECERIARAWAPLLDWENVTQDSARSVIPVVLGKLKQAARECVQAEREGRA